MKQIINISILLMISLLTACEIIISDGHVRYQPTVLKVYKAAYSSNYRDSNNNSYICDNRETRLSYRFSYSGKLDSWRSYLLGANSQKIRGERVYNPRSKGVISRGSDSYEVTYVIPPRVTPLATGSSKLTSQSIVVIPNPRNPKIIGYTYLILDIYGQEKSHNFKTKPPIPVVNSC